MTAPTPSEISRELDRYEGGIALLSDVCAGLSAKQATERPVAGRWSMLECMCHIADFEPIIAYRTKSMLAFEEPELVGIDETEYGRGLHYQKRDLTTELDVFVSTRKQLLRILNYAAPADFARTGRHTELGTINIWTYLLAASGHVEHHMRFMNEKRRAFGLAEIPCAQSRDYPARGTG